MRREFRLWFSLELASVAAFLLHVINATEVKRSVLVGIAAPIKHLAVCFHGLFLNILCIEFFPALVQDWSVVIEKDFRSKGRFFFPLLWKATPDVRETTLTVFFQI